MNKKLNNLLAYSIIVFLATLGGGALGYLSQTGLLDLYKAETSDTYLQRRYYLDRASTPITQEKYRRHTSYGWWIGCFIGAVTGAQWVRALQRK